jgi:hypothetical protein
LGLLAPNEEKSISLQLACCQPHCYASWIALASMTADNSAIDFSDARQTSIHWLQCASIDCAEHVFDGPVAAADSAPLTVVSLVSGIIEELVRLPRALN